MSLELGYNQDDLEKIRKQVEETEEYDHLNQKNRAAVLIAVQELSNPPEQSALDQFKINLSENSDVLTAIAFAKAYLNEKGFNKTLSVLSEEIHPEDLEKGERQMNSIMNEKYSNCNSHSEVLYQMIE